MKLHRDSRRSEREERGYEERRSHHERERPSREHGRDDRERRRDLDDKYSSRNRERAYAENGSAKEDAPIRRGRGSFRGGNELEFHRDRREGAGRHGTERGRGEDHPRDEGPRKAKVGP